MQTFGEKGMSVRKGRDKLKIESFEQVSSVIRPEAECLLQIGRFLNWFILTWIPWLTS